MAGKFKMAFGGLFRSLHTLWLEVTGAFLLIFAVYLGFHAVSEFRKTPAVVDNVWAIIAAALCLLFLGFGIHSFWKARKLR